MPYQRMLATFKDDDGLSHCFNLDWRIKPKTLRYRVALFTDGNEHWTETTRNDGTATLPGKRAFVPQMASRLDW